ncbi:TnsA endonuclease N-terminal domain-containing protein [Salinisphaera sp. P385]|uniref:TnsA endonuclease N-terminal domain-containing protein n=1 Tax=Spectribacter acetivorans TaxID=3075603 RepID=A0ABU3B784_9GAMM|nr:TnsA endonuclease N-terminal domain-containing protein [Salinisphaera sp. P385]MDT0618309.1 TnsA endonuclease N-terminal domain-containing protein [Salinisphaera sp. P385]
MNALNTNSPAWSSHAPLATQGNSSNIDFFNRLLRRSPELMTVTPTTYSRQSITRTVIRRGARQHHVGLYASRRNKALVPFESTLEKQACALLESQPRLVGYRTQPCAIQLPIDGKTRKVYPDFELTTVNGVALVDVKYEKASRKLAFQARASALQEYANQRGMNYAVLTEQHIRVPRMTATTWLMSLANGDARPQLHKAVRTWLSSLYGSTIGDLFDLSAGYPAVQNVLASSILDGHLRVDWDYPIKDQLVIFSIEEQ